MSGFSNPIVGGGGNLIRDSIQSPNFNLTSQTGWAIDQNGQAYFFQLDVTGNVIITNDNGVFVYSAFPPALGNLIGSFAGAAGVDVYGNSYEQGLSVGTLGTSTIQLVPNVSTPFNITSAIAGTLVALMQLNTSDTTQVFSGVIGALQLNTGNPSKQSLVLSSPFGNEGACIILESQDDNSDDVPVITFGTVSTPDDVTINFQPTATLTPYALLLYGGSSGITSTTINTPGSGTIPVPVGETSCYAESWGPGSGGGNGPGGGAGAYAAEPDLVVPSGGTIAYVVGSGGGSGHPGSAASTLTGSAKTVSANPGQYTADGTTGGLGGAAGSNTIAFAGGNGGNGDTASGTESVPFNTTYPAVATYTFEGTDGDSDPNPGYTPGARINVNGNAYQGDDQLGDNGNTSSLVVIPASEMQDAYAGGTVTTCKLHYENLHSWNDSGMTIALGYATYTGKYASFTSRELDEWGVTEDIQEFNISEGESGDLTLNSTFRNHILTTITAFLLYQPTSSRDYYGYFKGGNNWTVQIEGTVGGSTETGGGGGGGGAAGANGAGNPGISCTDGKTGEPGGLGNGPSSGNGGAGGNNGQVGGNGTGIGAGGGGEGLGGTSAGNGIEGQVRVTFSGGAPPIIVSIALDSGTDQFGTTYPAGANFAMPVVVDSISSGDSWHYVGAAGQPAFGSGWSNINASNDAVAFKFLSELNMVIIKGLAHNTTAANSAACFVLPAAYRPLTQQQFTCIENPGASPVLKTVAIQTNGDVLIAGGSAGTDAAGYTLDSVMYSLDIVGG